MKVLVFGTFDNLHAGHVFFICEAAKHGELHVVIARDKNVLRIKNKMPKQSEERRLDAVKHKFPGAHVQLGDVDDMLLPVRKIQPDLIIFGYDQKLPPGITAGDISCRIKRLPKTRRD